MDENANKDAEALVATFAKNLRELSGGGDIPSQWKKMVLAAIASKRGRKADPATATRDLAIATEMRRRRAAGEPPTSVAEEISQRLFDNTSGTGAPLEASRIFDIERERLAEVLADELIEEWLAEDTRPLS